MSSQDMSMKDKQRTLLMRVIGFGLILDYIALDQISKWVALEMVFKPHLNQETLGPLEWMAETARLPFTSIELFPFLNLTMVWNEGISFGLFQNGNPWPLIIIALIISVIFGGWLARTKSWIEVFTLPLIIGGALGNVIDRLHFGAVADFIDFHIGDWHYPAFNLADSFITVGIVILVVNSLFFQQDKEKAKQI